MFRDDTFTPSYNAPSPPSAADFPSSPAHANNDMDDVFGSAPASPSQASSFPLQQSNAEPSDIPRLRSLHSTAGYRDGLTASKATTMQEGFDEGFGLGATMGLRVGQILGTLEGLCSALSSASKPAKSDTKAEGEVEQAQEQAGDAERLTSLLAKARHELRTEGVFGTGYWGKDGVWIYDVPGEVEGWKDVVDAHPLVRRWEGTVAEEVERFGLDVTVLEGEGVKRLGEDEEATVQG